ncbi:MAG: SDR family NAD(P)-dependent oxidoreductase [Cyanothece sp. SIO1E1]|nr:SDR family NAD(P)-dependent oxidoreductase [Cyanothece sp. SIO1E1]
MIKSSLIIGATSPIAVALSRELAQQGCQYFWLVARDQQENGRLAQDLRHRFNVRVDCDTADLRHRELPERSAQMLGQQDFDLYFLAAGYLGDTSHAAIDIGESLRIADVNYTGFLPWINAITTPNRLDRPGQLMFMSSVAADRGRPSNYFYGASKAALTTLGEGLFLRCLDKPFRVSIVKAGYLDTAMTFGQAPAMLCASPQSIARSLVKRCNGRGIQYLPRFWQYIMFLIRLLPPSVVARL